MEYKLRIIVYMCGYGLDTAANEFLNTLQSLAVEHGEMHPESPVGFAILCAKVWGLFNGTKEFIFNTNDPFSTDLTSDTGNSHFRNPGDPKTINDFFERVKNDAHAEKNILIIWGHGGVYFTFSGQPDIKEFHNFLMGTFNKNINWVKGNVPEALSDMFQDNTEALSRQFADSVLSAQFHFKQKESGRLEEQPTLIPRTERALEWVKDFRKWQSHPIKADFEITFSQLGMDEVRKAINLLGQPVDLIIFDNCLMQCVDNITTLQTSTGLLLGSQDYLYIEDIKTAWEVKTILAHFDQSIRFIADALISIFDPQQPSSRLGCWAISGASTDGTNELLSAFKKLISLLQQHLHFLKPAIANARDICSNFTDDGIAGNLQAIPLSLVDLCWFLQNFRQQLNLMPLAISANDKADIDIALDENLLLLQSAAVPIIISSKPGENRKAHAVATKAYGAQGTSILFPRDKAELDIIKGKPAYKQLFDTQSSSAFMEQTGWKSFLEAYCST